LIMPQYIGGDPSQGTYNTTPPPGGEPPLSPSGHSYYTDEEFAAWDAAGRPKNHDYLKDPRGYGEPPGYEDPPGYGAPRGQGDGDPESGLENVKQGQKPHGFSIWDLFKRK
jgi:hypothetical protein